jgi:hypothetical protein
MPRFSLRTLIVVMLLGGPAIAALWCAFQVVPEWALLACAVTVALAIGYLAGCAENSWPRTFRVLFTLTVGGLLVILLLQIAEHTPLGERSFRHCVQCRVLQIDHAYLGWTWQTHHENEHTAWYRAHGPANHQHVWVGSSTPHTWQNWRGKNIGAGSKLENGVMTILTPAEQTAVYDRIGNQKTADAYFAQLRQRLAQDEQGAAIIAHELKRWIADDPKDTDWDAWQRAIEEKLSQ